jgi:hypothetical protein
MSSVALFRYEETHTVPAVQKQQLTWGNDEIWDFSVTIETSKSSLQILRLLLENTHLETKRGNAGKPEAREAKTRAFPSTERVEKGVTQEDLSIEAGKSPFPYRHR